MRVGTIEGEPGYSKLPESGDTATILDDWWMIVDESVPEINLKRLTIYGTLEFDSDSNVDHVLKAELIYIVRGRWFCCSSVVMKQIRC